MSRVASLSTGTTVPASTYLELKSAQDRATVRAHSCEDPVLKLTGQAPWRLLSAVEADKQPPATKYFVQKSTTGIKLRASSTQRNLHICLILIGPGL
jgi:hypothetical protein